MNISDFVFQAEEVVFKFINHTCASVWLDKPMMMLREAKTWIPLYLFMLLFFSIRFKRNVVVIILLSIVVFAITDSVSAQVLKPWIGRLRPCYAENLGFDVNNIAGCGGRFGFPSSHASNHFGLATFWFLVITNLSSHRWYWLFVWAALICLAQVYVGVHYPGDVLAGALFGSVTGCLGFYIFKFLQRSKQSRAVTEFPLKHA